MVTPQQLNCLKHLVAFMVVHGHSPTREELGAELGITGPSVHLLLDRLEDHGAVKRVPHHKRNVTPTTRGLAMALGPVL
jgi:DNA-binding MarR family transcriptional regulator